ncbi:hypothetical protein B0T24DRAFT_667390 [Lasiosphaeria ovina]|uniref:MYND-type domain-containing protein n=1 Tax=Lasiosphaeria ovina TaxID=92902 RepID=A0AAE0KDS8_9PEZI|nr:hypothetical protein B0T24DRAFT_667390 [Lasiosphaeria ovina]
MDEPPEALLPPIEELVSEFNDLPRPERRPDGSPNHWVFGTCRLYLDYDPTTDVIIAVNPQSNDVKMDGPGRMVSWETGSAQAEATVPYLLDAFLDDPRNIQNHPRPSAPWTWSTLDADKAQAVQDVLEKHGVRPEVCKVGVCSEEELEVLERVRGKVFQRLLDNAKKKPKPKSPVDPGNSTRCHGCGLKRQCFFTPLMMCSRCNKAHYHSRVCQLEHWTTHKRACAIHGALKHFYNRAAKDPDARALLKSLHLESYPVDQMLTLHLPLRRLVLAGQDTPENLELLFGPHYKQGVKKDHEDMRIECLLDPPPGSPSHAKYATTDAASLNASPRPATEAEQKMVKEVRDIQEQIRKRRAKGKPPSQEDMFAILWPITGRNWEAKYPVFVLARNTMVDPGVLADEFRGLSLSSA